jgi:hypothetical protein
MTAFLFKPGIAAVSQNGDVPNLFLLVSHQKTVQNQQKSELFEQWHCEGQGFDPPRLHHSARIPPR